jgi:hypothetical protein
MRFATLYPRKNYLDGHFILAQRRESSAWLKIETLSPRGYLHRFRIRTIADLSIEFKRFLRESYRVGQQNHLCKVQERRKPTSA